MRLWKQILATLGIDAKRLRIAWVSAAEGSRFATIIADFTTQLRELGPLWRIKEEDEKRLRVKLASAKELVPYLKLVESSKLIRLLNSSQTEADEVFRQKETERLYRELVEEKLVLSEIMSLLKERESSADEISEILDLSRSEISRCLGIAAKKGLVKWASGRFSVAPEGGGSTKP